MALSWDRELALYGGAETVCGCDEAGRGPLAGPVVAAAVVLAPGTEISGLDDSKKLSEKASALAAELCGYFPVDYDESGSIGKRYRREDEIGTPFCITYDFDSETDGCVTVRDRDTMEQVRLPIEALDAYIAERIDF